MIPTFNSTDLTGVSNPHREEQTGSLQPQFSGRFCPCGIVVIWRPHHLNFTYDSHGDDTATDQPSRRLAERLIPSYKNPVAKMASRPTIFAGRSCSLKANGIGATTMAKSLKTLRPPMAMLILIRSAQ